MVRVDKTLQHDDDLFTDVHVRHSASTRHQQQSAPTRCRLLQLCPQIFAPNATGD